MCVPRRERERMKERILSLSTLYLRCSRESSSKANGYQCHSRSAELNVSLATRPMGHSVNLNWNLLNLVQWRFARFDENGSGKCEQF